MPYTSTPDPNYYERQLQNLQQGAFALVQGLQQKKAMKQKAKEDDKKRRLSTLR